VHHVSDLHLKFALRPWQRLGEERKKEEEEERRNHRAKI